MSSTSMCIDGVTDNQDGLNICLSALDQQDPWLAVTLPSRSLVSEVVVYGRWDCCNDLLTGFEVWLGDEVGQPSVAGGWHLCGRHTQELAGGAGVTAVSCGVRRGTVATLVLPGSDRTIMIAEVAVRGYPDYRPSLPPSAGR